MSKRIEFKCTIPSIQSALKFGADVGRITFEVPSSELAEAVALIALQNTPLKVTVEVDDGNTKENDTKESSEAESTSGGRPWLRKRGGSAGRNAG